jgi:hypothetical protein
VPVFDARKITPDEVNFDNLDIIFPRFDGEIPIGSCVAVGHSISSYIGKKDLDDGDTKIHLATNVLFVIIFGIPLG